MTGEPVEPLAELGQTCASRSENGPPGVGQQALALLDGMPGEETADLDTRAGQRRVTKILAAVRTLADDITSGRREPPDTAEMHDIARAALRAEYALRSL